MFAGDLPLNLLVVSWQYGKILHGVVLKVLIKKGPLGIHGILAGQGTYSRASLGTGALNNYHIGIILGCTLNPKPCRV